MKITTTKKRFQNALLRSQKEKKEKNSTDKIYTQSSYTYLHLQHSSSKIIVVLPSAFHDAKLNHIRKKNPRKSTVELPEIPQVWGNLVVVGITNNHRYLRKVERVRDSRRLLVALNLVFTRHPRSSGSRFYDDECPLFSIEKI